MSDFIVAYKLKRSGCGDTWVHAGVTPKEAAKTLEDELTANEGLSPDEIDTIHIEAYWTTAEEIAALPEFEGW